MVITIAGEGWENASHLLGLLDMLNDMGDAYTLLFTMADGTRRRGAAYAPKSPQTFPDEYVDIRVWALPEDGGDATDRKERVLLRDVKSVVIEL